MRPFWCWSDGGSQVRWILVEPTGIPLAYSGAPLGASVCQLETKSPQTPRNYDINPD